MYRALAVLAVMLFACSRTPPPTPETPAQPQAAPDAAPLGAPAHCGGFVGAACPGKEECVDDPSDDCDPKKGGADCIGICQPK